MGGGGACIAGANGDDPVPVVVSVVVVVDVPVTLLVTLPVAVDIFAVVLSVDM